jgi:hypothetical protein
MAHDRWQIHVDRAMLTDLNRFAANELETGLLSSVGGQPALECVSVSSVHNHGGLASVPKVRISGLTNHRDRSVPVDYGPIVKVKH